MSEPANAIKTEMLSSLDERMLRVTMAAAALQARRVAQKMRMTQSEQDDVEQEILLVLLERRRYFNPAKGSWTPFVHRIARQAVQTVVDGMVQVRRTYGGPLDQPIQDAAPEETDYTLADVAPDPAAPTEMDHLVQHDIRSFVQALPMDLRIVAEGALESDGDLAEAQRALGLSTSEFYRRLREIRYRIFSIGLIDRRSL